VVSAGGFLIIPGPSDEPYVDMVWQVIAVGTKSEEPSEAPDSGAAVVPQDANTWGNNAGWLPQPPATAQELPRQNSAGLELYLGVAQGTAELALDTAKSLVLNALTFGGYGTWQLGKAIWAGYQDDRYVGALNAVNPLYQIARGGADTYMAAERENYRAAGAAGVKTVVLGTAAVVGAAQGVGALTGRSAAGAGGASGAFNYRETFFSAHPHLRGQVVVHHAVEQQILKRYPGLFSESEIHSMNNLRGIPRTVNPDVHLSQIRRAWNEFYRSHPRPTRQQVLDFAAELDARFQSVFQPSGG